MAPSRIFLLQKHLFRIRAGSEENASPAGLVIFCEEAVCAVAQAESAILCEIQGLIWANPDIAAADLLDCRLTNDRGKRVSFQQMHTISWDEIIYTDHYATSSLTFSSSSVSFQADPHIP